MVPKSVYSMVWGWVGAVFFLSFLSARNRNVDSLSIYLDRKHCETGRRKQPSISLYQGSRVNGKRLANGVEYFFCGLSASSRRQSIKPQQGHGFSIRA
jgi:hypothetical protein